MTPQTPLFMRGSGGGNRSGPGSTGGTGSGGPYYVGVLPPGTGYHFPCQR